MRVCDLNTGLGQISQAFSQLKERWNETQAVWTDDTRRRFEEQHLREIPTRMQQMLVAIQQLSEVLEKAQRDCEDNSES